MEDMRQKLNMTVHCIGFTLRAFHSMTVKDIRRNKIIAALASVFDAFWAGYVS